jgi:UDP-N-acetylglucosamine diphosphorylase / glucose-1-phosphate thymidylyltransferase / UDP-N-acetylgalactosamine diphosphorylase / glucosamine-1-phosphate N-acetyltransferase / galactosamine-1-phosphate N-acetyltransferase
MKAVILAAGMGQGMMPLTANTHKTLIVIGDRPLLEHSIDALVQNGIKDIFLVVSHRKDQIKRHFGDGSKFGANINYLEQENPKGGTADAVRCAGRITNESFILLNGDLFFHPNIVRKMIEAYKDCDGLIASKEVENPQDFGVLEVEDGKIVDIFEKLPNPPSKLCNLGIYILPQKIFEAIEKTQLSKRNQYELTDSIRILIDDGMIFKPVLIDDFWIDVGRLSDYEKARELFDSWRGD